MDNNNIQGEHVSQICRFYEKKTVFVTGGTGFLGKLLIEKLLRTTDVTTLFLLVRDKKGKNMHERLEELFEDVVRIRTKAFFYYTQLSSSYRTRVFCFSLKKSFSFHRFILFCLKCFDIISNDCSKT